VTGLELADLLGDLEPLCQQVDQGGVHVVDAVPQPQQLGLHLGIHLRRCVGPVTHDVAA
jgi:hypothetical protein